jgi:diacylglycerol kinase family enzyme
MSGSLPGRSRRVVACGALAAYAAALLTLAAVVLRNFVSLFGAWVALLVAALAAWYVVTRRRFGRLLAAVALVGAVVALVLVLVADRAVLPLGCVVLLGALGTVLTRRALEAGPADPAPAPTAAALAPPPHRPVLLVNPRSGGGKAARSGVAGEAARRGIEAVVMRLGDDLEALARDALTRGADALGMAGGDGSQALVAGIASEHDVPFVCVPAGTRNHLALDLGVDRDDVVGALDAFGRGIERRVDLARANGRVFVNNVSLGVYARIVQSPEYRDDKLGTVARMLPGLLGPDCEPFDLRFRGPTGNAHDSSDLVLVSNNVYDLDRIAGFGSRSRLDEGVLGIVAVEVRNAADLAELVALQTTGGVARFHGWRAWRARSFEVRSGEPIVAGVDGEARVFDAPLRFVTCPGALRVRVAARHASRPRAPVRPVDRGTLGRLVRAAARRVP